MNKEVGNQGDTQSGDNQIREHAYIDSIAIWNFNRLKGAENCAALDNGSGGGKRAQTTRKKGSSTFDMKILFLSLT